MTLAHGALTTHDILTLVQDLNPQQQVDLANTLLRLARPTCPGCRAWQDRLSQTMELLEAQRQCTQAEAARAERLTQRLTDVISAYQLRIDLLERMLKQTRWFVGDDGWARVLDGEPTPCEEFRMSGE